MIDYFFTRTHPASFKNSAIYARSFFLRCRQGFSTSSRRQVPSVPLNSPEAKRAQSWCTSLVRKYDAPSYTTSHFVQAHAVPALLAIRAFNIEISRIPDVVSNTLSGQMRHQFWRDTIDKTFDGNPPNEPVAVLLSSFMNDTGIRLNKTWFQKIITTREQAMNRPGFTDLGALERYAESTYSTLLYLTLSALPLNSLTADHIASHIGKAAGIAAVLRGVPLLAFPPPPNTHSVNTPSMGSSPTRDRQRIVNLPLDVMSQCGVQEEDIFRNGGNADGLRDAIFTVATRASDHLITARSLVRDIKSNKQPSHDFEHMDDEGHNYETQSEDAQSGHKRWQDFDRAYGTIMGPAISTQLWLDKLQNVDFDIFHNSLRMAEWKLPLVAWWRNRQHTL